MTAQPIRLHASTHLPEGQDPIEAIVFDYANGSATPPTHWFSLTTTVGPGGGSPALSLGDTSGDGVSISADGGGDLLLEAPGDVANPALGLVTIRAGNSIILNSFGGTQVQIEKHIPADPDPSFDVRAIQLAPILSYDVFRVDFDGTIHGKASIGVITWDL